jgi:transcriptional regulator with XRE-family HTH domain
VHTSTPPPVPVSPVLTGLGQALRWLRERQARKQYQVANDAGITKGMLSAYETGRQRPSLETLEKLLETLHCDLNDLHNALQIVNGRPERMKGWQLRDVRTDLTDVADLTDPNLEPWPDERPFGHAAHAALRRDTSHAVDDPGRSGPRQRPAAAGMQDLGFLSRMPGLYAGMPLAGEVRETGGGRPASELYRLLGLVDNDEAPLTALPPEEELALAQMLEGFHNLLRYWHRCLTSLTALAALAATTPQDPAESPGHRGGASEPAAPTAPTAGADEDGELAKQGKGARKK